MRKIIYFQGLPSLTHKSCYLTKFVINLFQKMCEKWSEGAASDTAY